MPSRPRKHNPHGAKAKRHQSPASAAQAAARRIRNSGQWQRTRARVMREQPVCWLCEQRGDTTEAEMVHHIRAVSERPDMAFDDTNLVPLCNGCHRRVEAAQQRGEATATWFAKWQQERAQELPRVF